MTLTALLTLAISLPAASQLQLEPCALPGFDAEGRCGRLTVPVDRSRPESASLDLEVVELPTRTGDVRPEPILYLVGGPGRPATGSLAFLSDNLRGLQAHHRLVLVDLRGTGRAARAIDCHLSVTETLDLLLATKEPPNLAECRKESGVDPSLLTTRKAALDLDVLRTELGVRQMHLVGISYGTRVAQVYAKLFPEHVSTLTLRGATVLGEPGLHRVAWGAARQLERTLDRCAADPSCSVRFPDPRSRLEALRSSLGRQPIDVDLGSGETLHFGPDHLDGLIRQTLYSSRGAATVPFLLDRFDDRNLRRTLGVFEGMLAELAPEAILSVFCAEDVPWFDRFGDAEPPSDLAAVQRAFAPLCKTWDVRPDPDVLAAETLDVPTLILSGSDDPATPADFATRASGYLPRSRFVETPGLGHFPTWTTCFARLTADLVDGTSLEDLDVSCAETDHGDAFLLEAPGDQRRRRVFLLASGLGALLLAVAVVLGRRRRRNRRSRDAVAPRDRAEES